MSDSYFIRVRGRVHGPASFEQLKILAAKGQLSRAHELSTDGKSWVSASTKPEIFERPQPEEPAKSQPSVPAPSVTAPVATKQWHYTAAGTQMGPITSGSTRQRWRIRRQLRSRRRLRSICLSRRWHAYLEST